MPTAIDDSLAARVTPECPDDVRNVLYSAWGHDLGGLKALLNDRAKASIQDPKTGETPLHAAIRACGPSTIEDQGRDVRGDKPEEEEGEEEGEEEEEDGQVESAKEILQELFLSGAIWNDVDANNETPGCVAHRLGHHSLYNTCVEAGVRAELLFALMAGGYEELSSDDEDDNDDAQREQQSTESEAPTFVPLSSDDKPVTSEEYLNSALTYDDSKLLDADLNGVMMAWETDIMRRSVAALIPDATPGKRILNIGFGMGIVDGLFAKTNPSRHHIIEAHPAVLEHLSRPGSSFGADWERSGPEEGAYKVFAGKWQDVALKLLDAGETYDAIYFDTFGEDYSQLRNFFTEYLPGLLDMHGCFSFFNGLGADRKICYDVYAKVVEMHCADAGLDVEWDDIDVDMTALGKDGEGEWEGVRRRYWTLDKYRLPRCTFMG